MNRQTLFEKWPELPEKYVDFLERYPQRMKDAGDLSKIEFLSELNDIESLNLEIDMVDGLDSSGYFAIGHSGCGDYYLMELGCEEPSVILWNHEIGELDDEEEFGSIEEFAGAMLEARDYVKNMQNKKPWWKLF